MAQAMARVTSVKETGPMAASSINHAMADEIYVLKGITQANGNLVSHRASSDLDRSRPK